MAFATVVSLANIGSFLLQTASFGQVIVTNTTRVQQLLRSAQRELEEAGKELVKFYHIIDTGEEVAVDDLFDKHTALLDSIEQQLERLRNQQNFLMKAKVYKAEKDKARSRLADCTKFRDQVVKVSFRCQGRMRKEEKAAKEKAEQERISLRQVTENSSIFPPPEACPWDEMDVVSNPFGDTD